MMRSGSAPLTVVKIGGSLLGGRRLRGLLTGLPSGQGLVLVPGGGAFADAVRLAQAQAGFDDTLAHRLALDAMGAMAQVFRALRPDVTILRAPADLAAAAYGSRLPVWTPADLRSGHPEIAESWDVTSDSLSLWLAREIGAARLVLVKSADAPPEARPAQLAAFGLVDAAFATLAESYCGRISICGPGENLMAVLAAHDGDLAAPCEILDPAAP